MGFFAFRKQKTPFLFSDSAIEETGILCGELAGMAGAALHKSLQCQPGVGEIFRIF